MRLAALGLLAQGDRFGCALLRTCRGILLATRMGERPSVVNRPPRSVATMGISAGSSICLGSASMRIRSSRSSTDLGFSGLPANFCAQGRRSRSIWPFSSSGFCSSGRLFPLLPTSAVLCLMAFAFGRPGRLYAPLGPGVGGALRRLANGELPTAADFPGA